MDWIDPNQQSPDDKQEVLIQTERGDIVTASYWALTGHYCSSDARSGTGCKVVGWMPAPDKVRGYRAPALRLFSERMRLAERVDNWIEENQAAPCTLSVITALQALENHQVQQLDENHPQFDALIRAFWRRIEPYKYNHGRELPTPLPVEFRAHMATALMVFR